jgi:hypothetical protein
VVVASRIRRSAVPGRLLLENVETHHGMTFATLNGEAAEIACDAAVAHWERHLRPGPERALEHPGPATVVDLFDRPA